MKLGIIHPPTGEKQGIFSNSIEVVMRFEL